jgi:hypothetical protein
MRQHPAHSRARESRAFPLAVILIAAGASVDQATINRMFLEVTEVGYVKAVINLNQP